MTTYFLVYAWIAAASVLLYVRKIEYQKAVKWFCAVSFMAVCLLFALRHPFMGGDLRYGWTTGYLSIFTQIADFSWQEVFSIGIYYFERGYILFNKLLSLISDDHQLLLTASAVLSLGPVWYTICKESKQPDLSVYVFMGLPVFVLLFSGIRQGIAVGLCMLALLWVIRKKWISFILTV